MSVIFIDISFTILILFCRYKSGYNNFQFMFYKVPHFLVIGMWWKITFEERRSEAQDYNMMNHAFKN